MAVFHYATGKAHWAKILGAPVPNYNRDGNEWTVDFTPNAEGLALIHELGIGHKIKNKSDEREDFIQFKQRETRPDGSANFPITVVDARNRPWDPDVKIGNGSIVEVKFKVVDYGKDKAKSARYGVYPQAIRVLELVPYARQEFAPLPEDNEYVKNFSDDFSQPVEDFGDDVLEDDILEG